MHSSGPILGSFGVFITRSHEAKTDLCRAGLWVMGQLLGSLISVSFPRSIASYDTREDEQSGVGPGDALRDIHEDLISLAPGEGDSNNHADNESDAERPLLDTDSAHEDESQHKAFVRRRNMTVHVHSSYACIHTPIHVPGCKCEPSRVLDTSNQTSQRITSSARSHGFVAFAADI